jgi:GT2 family glycosyltransferase
LALQAREVSFASGCAMLIRCDVMRQLKGFDERFFMYEEDVEMCLRINEYGWKILYEPAALVLHVVQASSRGEQKFIDRLSPLNKNLSFYVFHTIRNRLINMRLHARGRNRLIFIAGFSLFLFKMIVSYILHKRWDGIAAIFKGWRSYCECYALNFHKEKL